MTFVISFSGLRQHAQLKEVGQRSDQQTDGLGGWQGSRWGGLKTRRLQPAPAAPVAPARAAPAAPRERHFRFFGESYELSALPEPSLLSVLLQLLTLHRHKDT